jgi:hypothetical protein
MSEVTSAAEVPDVAGEEAQGEQQFKGCRQTVSPLVA